MQKILIKARIESNAQDIARADEQFKYLLKRGEFSVAAVQQRHLNKLKSEAKKLDNLLFTILDEGYPWLGSIN